MLAIKIKDSKSNVSQYLYFDAITTYQKSYPNTVTKHPVEDGSTISDHTTDENMQMSFSGIISNADWHSLRPTRGAGAFDEGKTITFSNDKVLTEQTRVTSEGLVDYLPNSITQFLPSRPPSVSMSNQARETLQQDMQKALLAARDRRDVVSIIEFGTKLNTITEVHDNMIITNLAFDENADSGDALFVAMALEQVRFVDLVKTTVPKDAIPANEEGIKDSATPNDNKGLQQAEEAPDFGSADYNNCFVPAYSGQAIPSYCRKYNTVINSDLLNRAKNGQGNVVGVKYL